MEALARAIAQKVLERLRSVPEATRVLVLGPRDAALATRLAEELTPGTAIHFQGEGACSDDAERILLPFLSCAAMADLAAGRASDAQTSAVLQLLLAGRPVEVLELEYLQHCGTAPAALYALYEHYEETLQSYGLARFASEKAQRCILRENLITAAHVEQARKAGASALIVPANALVTPAAKDAAKDLSIGIEKRL